MLMWLGNMGFAGSDSTTPILDLCGPLYSTFLGPDRVSAFEDPTRVSTITGPDRISTLECG